MVSSEQQLCQYGEELVEWRSSEIIENGTPSTSPPYWESGDDDGGPKPSELYGKYTWKIDNFSTINKRELRSSAFEVGGYEWYILIYPQGCDVCNHLSLFLCVANHDKLLPGWSHFAQFTIAVVNKDPKKSKYSDTLHRFWKKEHDWGWKKFMELSKMMDGFIDADTLIIKAQVQVIRERADRPFRCLDYQYRRELVRVYLTNVEQICRRFVEERRGKLEKLIEDKARWASFRAFWLGMDQSSRRHMSREKTESILKMVVKHFFIEKEVTSTLVMDSLYSGMKALEGQAKGKKSKLKNMETEEVAVPVICIEKETLVLEDDVLLLLERAAMQPLPPKDEKGPQNRTKDGAAGEEFNKDSIERDERRLTELGRRTIEIFVLAHIFSKIEVAYQEAISLKRQEELIREEEEAWLADIEQKMRRGAVDKEKKSKKKQGKQKRNNRKSKDKARDDKPYLNVQDNTEQNIPAVEIKDFLNEETETIFEKPDTVEDNSDASDSAECIPELIQPYLKDEDASPVNCATDVVEVHLSTEVISSEIDELSRLQIGLEGISLSIVDDSSSTCSTDSVLSAVTRVTHNGNSRNHKIDKHSICGRSPQCEVTPERVDLINEEHGRITEVPDAGHLIDASQASKTAESTYKASVRCSQDSPNMIEMHSGKEELHRNPSGKDAVVVDLFQDQTISPPRSPSRSISSMVSPKLESKSKAANNLVVGKKPSSENPRRSARIATSSDISTTSKRNVQKFTTPKHTDNTPGLQVSVVSEKIPTQHVQIATEKPSIPQIPVMSRPLSAPICPAPRPTASMVTITQTAPVLARSVSATGRLGLEATTSTQSYVPQSYRNAIIGNLATGNSSGYMQNHSASSTVNASQSYSQAPPLVSSPLFLPHNSGRMSSNPIRSSFPMTNNHDMLQSRPIWMEISQRENCRNLSGDSGSVLNDMQSYELYEPLHHRSQEHLSSELPACTSGRQTLGLADDFPHIDIINDLLDDEHGIGMGTQMNAGYLNFSNVPPNLNRQFSFPVHPGMSSGLSQTSGSCLSERAQNYVDNGFQLGYGSFSGILFDSGRDIIPQTCPQPYVNGQIDSRMPNQWQLSGSDIPYRNIRNADNDGYSYHLSEFPNHTMGANGFTVFRPSSGL